MIEIKNLKVYGLEKSIIRSGYPMQIGEPGDLEFESENLSYWFDNGLAIIVDRLNYSPISSKKTDIEYHRKTLNDIKEINETYSIINLRDNNGDISGELIVDNIDLKTILSMKWSKAQTGYAMSCNNGLCHRIILCPNDNQVVDHINNNKLDNRRQNLRIVSTTENLRNKKKTVANKSGIVGVSYKNDKNQWKSYLTVNYKQIHLGYFDLFEDAVKARLNGELSYFKQYSPQIKLLEIYDMENPYKDLYTVVYKYNLKSAVRSYKRILNLSKTPLSSGHNCALKGIIVQFDLKYPQYFTPQLQRYHWVDIVSSQSKMHSLTKIKCIKDNCNKYVTYQSTKDCNSMILSYNNEQQSYPFIYENDNDENFKINSKEELFQYIISNLPCGFELWMAISTNYLQLKTIYNQRCKHKHKLQEWEIFGNFIKELPMSELITGKDA